MALYRGSINSNAIDVALKAALNSPATSDPGLFLFI